MSSLYFITEIVLLEELNRNCIIFSEHNLDLIL
jgi:hypothetical protein